MKGTCIAAVVCLLGVFGPTNGLPPPPRHTEFAKAARWLMCAANWGVVATDGAVANKDLDDSRTIPFANVVAVSDGVWTGSQAYNCTGEPFFYLTNLDITARELGRNEWASLTISMASLLKGKFCTFVNAEDPTCWRLTLTGKVKKVDDANAQKHALESLFSRHGDMKYWPRDHEFVPMQMQVEKIFFLDFYGGPHHISVPEYLGSQKDLTQIRRRY